MDIESIIITCGDGTRECWELDLPADAMAEIVAILEKYEHRGTCYKCEILEV